MLQGLPMFGDGAKTSMYVSSEGSWFIV